MNYTKLSEMAKRKCKQFGSIGSIIKTESIYDKETHAPMDIETRESGFCIISAYDESMANGTTVLQGDLKVTFTPTDTANPASGDRIEIGKNQYNIVNVMPLSPNGSTVIMYDLQVRA